MTIAQQVCEQLTGALNDCLHKKKDVQAELEKEKMMRQRLKKLFLIDMFLENPRKFNNSPNLLEIFVKCRKFLELFSVFKLWCEINDGERFQKDSV